MTETVRTWSIVAASAAGMLGCAEGAFYDGTARIQPVAYVDRAGTQISGDLEAAAVAFVRATDAHPLADRASATDVELDESLVHDER